MIPIQAGKVTTDEACRITRMRPQDSCLHDCIPSPPLWRKGQGKNSPIRVLRPEPPNSDVPPLPPFGQPLPRGGGDGRAFATPKWLGPHRRGEGPIRFAGREDLHRMDVHRFMPLMGVRFWRWQLPLNRSPQSGHLVGFGPATHEALVRNEKSAASRRLKARSKPGQGLKARTLLGEFSP